MIVIRAAGGADRDAIARIQRASPEASPWPPFDYDCRVAMVDDRLAGFLVVRAVAADEREILNLAIDPDFRRRGIASALIRNVVSEMPGAWFLEVRESNQRAIHLYQKLGFALAGKRPGYYQNPAEAAIVMTFFS